MSEILVNDAKVLKAQKKFNKAKGWPEHYWFEIYPHGNKYYLMARWGWQKTKTRHGAHIGPLEESVYMLLKNFEYLCPEAKDSLGYLIGKHLPKFKALLEKVSGILENHTQEAPHDQGCESTTV